MATIVSPLITGNQVRVVAKGYVKGTISSYAGLVVTSTGQHGPNVSQTFFIGGANAASFLNDYTMVQMHLLYVQNAFGQSVGSGQTSGNSAQGGVTDGGVTYDQSVFNVLADYYAANG